MPGVTEDGPMPWSKEERDQKSFEQVLQAFAGRRYALAPASSKLLRFMLESPDGCDATLSADRFEIRFGWHPSRHRYHLRTAPGIVSWLLDLAKAPAGKRNLQALIGPAAVPAMEQAVGDMGWFPAWSFGSRRIWLDSSPTRVSVRARSAEPGVPAGSSAPEPLPEPIAHAHGGLEWPSPISCPYCRTPSRTYRELQRTHLVCGACGRSFAIAHVT
jgi:hypothetical protein